MQLLDIIFFVPGMRFDGETLEKSSLGGSETAGLCMARELAALGHNVTMFSNCQNPGEYNGVTYYHVDDFLRMAVANPHDVTIVQRHPVMFSNRFNSRLNLLWVHDLALLRSAAQFKGVVWNVDKVMTVSNFMTNQYKEVYGLPEELMWTTRNGIDLDALNKIKVNARNKKALVYTARPERGIDNLLIKIFPQLLQIDPEYELHVAGYDNTVPHLEEFYGQVKTWMSGFGDRCVWHGHLKKEDLYRLYASSGAYVYPTPSRHAKAFAEVSCITAMECMALGLPFISTDRGALRETLGDNAGSLIEGNPWSEDYPNKFIEAILSATKDDVSRKRMEEAGRNRAKDFSWADLAIEWSAQFERLIQERNESIHRRAYHFIRRSDIIAVKELLKNETDDESMEIKNYIEKSWGFSESDDKSRIQAEKVGVGHTDVFDASPGESRFNILEKWIHDRPEIERILDFGCAHGSYSVNLCNRVGRMWTGVDIDKYSIEWCERNRSVRGKYPQNMEFMVGNDEVDLSNRDPYDMLLAMEVLEHVIDPVRAINNLERWIKPGGKVFITVPFGPWEYLSYDTYPHRAHLWEFDLHDLRDIFGKKNGLKVWAMASGIADTLNEPVGWHFIEYVVDGTPCGQIDMDRKNRIQRPRQTLSAMLIAGPESEQTLEWCLKSLKHAADEIVIADTGMSARALNIARSFNARIVRGDNPKESGFEVPRNQALEACRMDWVLWIDTDEKLIGTNKIHKYIRENIFDGYSIRQHHFAVDTTFKPDMPVRLFRTRARDGKKMRFYGMIHEHPEFGLNDGPGRVIVLADVNIAHVGYLTEDIRRERFARNYPLLQKDIDTYPNRLLQKHFVCRDNILLCMYELQQNGGRITPNIVSRAEETIRIYRENFLGKHTYANIDTLQYYSQAVKLLGLGFEAAYQVSIDKENAKLNGENRIQFASVEDMEMELMRAAKEQAAPFVSEWW